MPTLATSRGFTLTELAVVLVIVALIIGGLLMPLGGQRELEQRRETQRALESIREALIGYAIQNGRLPCPAEAGIASGATGAGFEATTSGSSPVCSCTATSATSSNGIAAANATACAANASTINGVLPWAALGLPETDAWQRRFTYQVTGRFARRVPQTGDFDCTPPYTSTAPANASFALCTPGHTSLRTSAAGNAITANDEVPAVVLSHGVNGLGAYLNSGVQISVSAGDEGENADSDSIFVSNTTIDDQLVWLSRPILMNRMISAGKLP